MTLPRYVVGFVWQLCVQCTSCYMLFLTTLSGHICFLHAVCCIISTSVCVDGLLRCGVLCSVFADRVLDSVFCAFWCRCVYQLYAVLWPLHSTSLVCLLSIGSGLGLVHHYLDVLFG